MSNHADAIEVAASFVDDGSVVSPGLAMIFAEVPLPTRAKYANLFEPAELYTYRDYLQMGVAEARQFRVISLLLAAAMARSGDLK